MWTPFSVCEEKFKIKAELLDLIRARNPLLYKGLRAF